ncbi:DUF2971 domain-containing protein [Sporosarcina sp. G11-34]|uniref:DUF2971 domain-containing protein n=1 Tax=Sporosarcina sp. G11-34 TaxID=2849605 RepID=UPI0022A9BF33|nr:DUF2971 domain-containing protein [Sporosarcina sp. G11-34]MCZ2260603.1 DUF2971 domain-containing protein [Sporosarcina sp. G11-34]
MLGYSYENWRKRIQYRTDLSGYVYHLTKAETNNDGKENLSALDRLVKIITERKLIGSSTKSGFITGDRKTVCFQDAPISGIVQNVLHENTYKEDLGGKIRYTYFGLAFPKPYIFQQGGRPVFYEEKANAKNILPLKEHWRIVDFSLLDKDNIVDWTHEREWRLPADEFHFELSKATILLPNEATYRLLIDKLSEDDLKAVMVLIQISPLVF